MNNFESLIRARRSTRKFTGQPITPEEVQKLLQAALLAPTAKNLKSWEFVAVDNKNMLQQLSTCKDSGAIFLEGCALAVVMMGDTSLIDTWIEDASIAAAYIQLQAEDLGIGSCWCHIRNRYAGDFASEQLIRELLGIPDHFDIVCIIGFGNKEQAHTPKDISNLSWEKVHIGHF